MFPLTGKSGWLPDAKHKKGFFICKMKKKVTTLNKLRGEKEQLYKQVKGLLNSKKNIVAEIRSKDKEIASIESEFSKDISEFPLDLNKRLQRAKKEKDYLELSLSEINKKLYGTKNGKTKGLIFEHDKRYEEYKKTAIDNDELYYELDEKEINSKLNTIAEKIKNKLKQYNISVNGPVDNLDLQLDILDRYTSLKDENNYEGNEDEMFDKVMNEMLKEKFKIDFEANSSKPTEDELTIKKEINIIILETKNMGIKTKSVKSYLQEKLKGIWEKYKNNKQIALGLLQKEFARKYFWEYGIKEIKRYKDFESFYKNIFLK